MKQSTPQIFDIIVVGAGHAGLSISYFLSRNNLNHTIFERGQIGESWRSQRWDSFVLNTPNFMNFLPGETCQNLYPEKFMPRDQVIAKLKDYVEKFQLPVQEHSTVTSVTKMPGEQYFSIKVRHFERITKWFSKQVVIASGAMSANKIPSFSKVLSKNIYQIHVADYRNQSQLPEGGVLIVGSGQSGCQVAEDLVANGREIYLSTSKVGRNPRRYRGKDILDWLIRMKYYDEPTGTVTDHRQLTETTPLLSGVGVLGHTISLQSLHKQGIMILGHLSNIENYKMMFASDVEENVLFGDEFSEKMKAQIDDFILKEGFIAEDAEEDEADRPDINASCAEPISSLNCHEKNIKSVIWTTGFTSDFSWIKLPVFDANGKPVHYNGVSKVPGLFFLGIPWLRSRKSGIIFGITEDAEYITMEILKNHQ